MSRIPALRQSLLATVILLALAPIAAFAEPIAITAARMVDVDSGTLRNNAVVVIDGFGIGAEELLFVSLGVPPAVVEQERHDRDGDRDSRNHQEHTEQQHLAERDT